jgi:predicted RNA-binding protein with PUA-like domain
MQYWLMKSEPNTFGINDLKNSPNSTDHWDGIRNYQARNMIRDDMQPGDLAFFYHSNCKPPGIVGMMKIISSGYVDHTAFDPQETYYDPKSNPEKPRWYMVDVQYLETFAASITLNELKANPALEGMRLLKKGNRLSILPITEHEWHTILAMRDEKTKKGTL